MPVDDIAKMTDAQLEAYLAPYFPLTRPLDLTEAGGSVDTSHYAPEVQAALAALQKPSLISQLRALKPTP